MADLNCEPGHSLTGDPGLHTTESGRVIAGVHSFSFCALGTPCDQLLPDLDTLISLLWWFWTVGGTKNLSPSSSFAWGLYLNGRKGTQTIERQKECASMLAARPLFLFFVQFVASSPGPHCYPHSRWELSLAKPRSSQPFIDTFIDMPRGVTPNPITWQ